MFVFLRKNKIKWKSSPLAKVLPSPKRLCSVLKWSCSLSYILSDSRQLSFQVATLMTAIFIGDFWCKSVYCPFKLRGLTLRIGNDQSSGKPTHRKKMLTFYYIFKLYFKWIYFQPGLLSGKMFCSLKIKCISDIQMLLADEQEFMSKTWAKKNSLQLPKQHIL